RLRGNPLPSPPRTPAHSRSTERAAETGSPPLPSLVYAAVFGPVRGVHSPSAFRRLSRCRLASAGHSRQLALDGLVEVLIGDLADLLAFDVSARLALRLEEEADGPRLAPKDGGVQSALGVVGHRLPAIHRNIAQAGVSPDEVVNGLSGHPERAPHGGEVAVQLPHLRFNAGHGQLRCGHLF